MYEYSHGGNAAFESGNENIIDLSANINPLGLPTGVSHAIISEISKLMSYPDNSSRKLRDKIAEFENVDPEWIFCSNGGSDIIFWLPRAMKAKKVMLMAPTFSDYERSAASYGANIIHHFLSVDNDFDIDRGLIDAVRHNQPDLIYICNPNNPTGRLTDINLIRELLDIFKANNSYVAIDECFLDFTDGASNHTSKVFLEDYSNLIILKAFTKLFTMPGVRLGYALCSSKEIIDSLYFHGPDWAVSNLAQSAGIAALEGADAFVKATVEYVSEERNKLENELMLLGYQTFEAKANYIFFRSLYAFDLKEELNKEGIRIRSCSNYHGLDSSYYRIAVSTKENNEAALQAIAQITKGYNS